MSFRYYVLDANHQLVETDMLTWARWFERFDDRRVARTEIGDAIVVSTVFLGLDHRFSGEGPPLVFETMSFFNTGRTERLEGMTREWHATWTEALLGHDRVVEDIRKRSKQIDDMVRAAEAHDRRNHGTRTP